MLTHADLEALPSRHLHEQAIGFAKADDDLDWLWHLLRSIPAMEGQVGDLEDSGMDVASTVSAINGCVRADRELSDALRPDYIDYILEHQ